MANTIQKIEAALIIGTSLLLHPVTQVDANFNVDGQRTTVNSNPVAPPEIPTIRRPEKSQRLNPRKK